jgi:hypothetical protein
LEGEPESLLNMLYVLLIYGFDLLMHHLLVAHDPLASIYQISIPGAVFASIQPPSMEIRVDLVGIAQDAGAGIGGTEEGLCKD